jgi:hypothetical protein
LYYNEEAYAGVASDGKNGCIEESMEESPHIHLSYKQNSFSIAFSAIDYSG